MGEVQQKLVTHFTRVYQFVYTWSFYFALSLAGVSRSATVVLAHLMNSDQMLLDEATDFVKSVYPRAK